jgi:hypothetical protein
VIVKPKLNIPPQKLQFNPITAAVNNSISSVGTNTLTTPIGTARKFDLKHSYTDRAMVDKINESYVKKLDQSPVVKSVSQHTEPRSNGNAFRFQIPHYSGGGYNQTINMSYFMQNQTTDQDSAENSLIQKNSLHIRSPQSSQRTKPKFPVKQSAHQHSGSGGQSAIGYYSKNEIKVHKGAFNLRCVTQKPPSSVLEELTRVL